MHGEKGPTYQAKSLSHSIPYFLFLFSRVIAVINFLGIFKDSIIVLKIEHASGLLRGLLKHRLLDLSPQKFQVS